MTFAFEGKNRVVVSAGVQATALELGQWEIQMGEYEEAEYSIQSPVFDYAAAVEDGTVSPIDPGKDMVFWGGDYNEDGTPRNIRTRQVAGQSGLKFVEDAILITMPQVDQFISRLGSNVRLDDLWKVK